MPTIEALQNWMVGFVNENARREQLTFMHRHLVKPFELTPTKFLQRIRIMTALLEFLPTTERKLRNISKDELKYIYVYAMPNTFLNKTHEVNFRNVKQWTTRRSRRGIQLKRNGTQHTNSFHHIPTVATPPNKLFAPSKRTS